MCCNFVSGNAVRQTRQISSQLSRIRVGKNARMTIRLTAIQDNPMNKSLFWIGKIVTAPLPRQISSDVNHSLMLEARRNKTFNRERFRCNLTRKATRLSYSASPGSVELWLPGCWVVTSSTVPKLCSAFFATSDRGSEVWNNIGSNTNAATRRPSSPGAAERALSAKTSCSQSLRGLGRLQIHRRKRYTTLRYWHYQTSVAKSLCTNDAVG